MPALAAGTPSTPALTAGAPTTYGPVATRKEVAGPYPKVTGKDEPGVHAGPPAASVPEPPPALVVPPAADVQGLVHQYETMIANRNENQLTLQQLNIAIQNHHNQINVMVDPSTLAVTKEQRKQNDIDRQIILTQHARLQELKDELQVAAVRENARLIEAGFEIERE